MATFDNVWSWLQNNLKSGQIIKNWSVLRGGLGRATTILDVCKDYIKVDPPNAKNIQVVRREDFKKLWEDWPAYKSGKVLRSTFPEKTRFVTYTISILHYYEQEVVGNAWSRFWMRLKKSLAWLRQVTKTRQSNSPVGY